jgi:hypothetical protein
MKLIFILSIAFTLSACGVMRDQNGNTVSAQDRFECDHKCGLYDLRQSPIAVGMCLSSCEASKGYRLHKN